MSGGDCLTESRGISRVVWPCLSSPRGHHGSLGPANELNLSGNMVISPLFLVFSSSFFLFSSFLLIVSLYRYVDIDKDCKEECIFLRTLPETKSELGSDCFISA